MTRAFIIGIAALQMARAADWPQFLGPDRNGSTREVVASDWDAKAPKQTWTKRVGSGFAGPAVVGETLILFHRDNGSEIIAAIEARTGKTKWENKAPAEYKDDFGFDEGPRATPCITGGRVYTMGADGHIRCVSLQDGQQVWSVHARKDFGAGKGFFGMACSPLVHGSNLFLNIGGASGAGIVALNKDTGAVQWKATEHEASYASPVLGRVGEQTALVFFTREGLVLLDPESGKSIAQRSWRSRMHASVNAATPLLIDGALFATSSYDTGAILARLEGGELKEVWSGEDILSCHYATPVHFEGKLFGFHGRQEMGQSFRCVEMKSGKVLWEEDGIGAGSATLAGSNLLILKENGELLLVPASAKSFTIAGRAQFLGSDTRAFPAVSGKRFFARDKRNLVCVELP